MLGINVAAAHFVPKFLAEGRKERASGAAKTVISWIFVKRCPWFNVFSIGSYSVTRLDEVFSLCRFVQSNVLDGFLRQFFDDHGRPVARCERILLASAPKVVRPSSEDIDLFGDAVRGLWPHLRGGWVGNFQCLYLTLVPTSYIEEYFLTRTPLLIQTNNALKTPALP